MPFCIDLKQNNLFFHKEPKIWW